MLDSVTSHKRSSASKSPLYDPAASTQSPSTPLVDAPLEIDGPILSPEQGDEEEEGETQAGAFNEETGEINWDCACLGGMAHGPCGEQFRTAFSCFVFSSEEPKGMDCIDHFKNMQGCFREHPDIYGAELDEDEKREADGLRADGPAGTAAGEVDGAQQLLKSDSAPSGEVISATAVRSENGGRAKQEPESTLASNRGAGNQAQSLPPVSSAASSPSSTPSTTSSSPPASPSSKPTESSHKPSPQSMSLSKSKADSLNPERDIDEPMLKAVHDATGTNEQ